MEPPAGCWVNDIVSFAYYIQTLPAVTFSKVKCSNQFSRSTSSYICSEEWSSIPWNKAIFLPYFNRAKRYLKVMPLVSKKAIFNFFLVSLTRKLSFWALVFLDFPYSAYRLYCLLSAFILVHWLLFPIYQQDNTIPCVPMISATKELVGTSNFRKSDCWQSSNLQCKENCISFVKSFLVGTHNFIHFIYITDSVRESGVREPYGS